MVSEIIDVVIKQHKSLEIIYESTPKTPHIENSPKWCFHFARNLYLYQAKCQFQMSYSYTVIHKSAKMKGDFGVGTFRSGLISLQNYG